MRNVQNHSHNCVYVLGDMTGDSKYQESALLKLCCLLHCGTSCCITVSSSLIFSLFFPHAV